MTCPYLTYRATAGEQSFDEPRAYCAVAETFVQPMRADVCNDRYGLSHATDCEIFLAHESDDGDGEDGAADDDATEASDDDATTARDAAGGDGGEP
jgi:hypothetical protein